MNKNERSSQSSFDLTYRNYSFMAFSQLICCNIRIDNDNHSTLSFNNQSPHQKKLITFQNVHWSKTKHVSKRITPLCALCKALISNISISILKFKWNKPSVLSYWPIQALKWMTFLCLTWISNNMFENNLNFQQNLLLCRKYERIQKFAQIFA